MSAARIVLATVGIALMAVGVVLLISSLSLPQLVALTVWLAGVILIHDAVLAPTVSWLRNRWYAGDGARAHAITAAVHIGFVVGGVLTLFVVPEIWAQGRGNPNPTILIGDYAARLVAVWSVIGVVVLVIARVVIRRSRRTRR